MTAVLGLSAFYHDSAACLVIDGEIVAAAQEERFTRTKHDFGFPAHAIRYCLDEAGLAPGDLSYVGFYDKPILKFDRLLETYLACAPRGFRSFVKAMPLWMKEKLWITDLIRRQMAEAEVGGDDPKAIKRRAASYGWKVLYGDHHESHAASAFYPSPFEEAAILTVDGVGEWSTASLGVGRGRELTLLKELRFPHSLGLLYSAFTYFTGFKVNSGEYKIMGLAPYGEPKYVDLIRTSLVDVRDDGSMWMNPKYFTYSHGLTMTGDAFAELFGAPAREPESPLTQREMDLARSVQEVTEEVLLKMAAYAHRVTGQKQLCLAGGVALNCVANGRLLREGPFDDLWIQPAAGDAGGALGVAQAIWHHHLGHERSSPERAGTWVSSRAWRGRAEAAQVADAGFGAGRGSTGAPVLVAAPVRPYADGMRGSFLGPRFSSDAIAADLQRLGRPYRRVSGRERAEAVAALLGAEKVLGVLQGRMEFGPRALGGRSILGDPRSSKMQSVMNLKIKYRESFRPFAPSVMREHVSEWFELEGDSPYMLLVADVHRSRQRAMTDEERKLWGIEKLNVPRSDIPAVTHVDYSARIQTVDRATAPEYWAILDAFHRLTGCPVLVNTSFNVRGEPIVCTPEDAYRCFMRTEMDALVLEDCILEKADQPAWADQGDWRREFQLD
jgi:carbamoyltransferase